MQISKEKPLNFVLIDGTWSNSAAMYRRLKVHPDQDFFFHVTIIFIFKGCSEVQTIIMRSLCWKILKFVM